MTITIRIPSDSDAAIRKVATSEDRSINWVIVQAIKTYVADVKRPTKMSQTRGYFEAIHPTARTAAQVAKPSAPKRRSRK